MTKVPFKLNPKFLERADYVVLVGLLILLAILALDPRFVVGEVKSALSLPGGLHFLQIESPSGDEHKVVYSGPAAPSDGDWAIAVGEPRTLLKWEVLWAAGVETLPGAARFWRSSIRRFAELDGLLAIKAAAILLAMQLQGVRLLGGVFAGIIVALGFWHGSAAAAVAGEIETPQALFSVVLVAGFTFGALLGLRIRTPLAYLGQRLGMIALLLACRDGFAGVFGWAEWFILTAAVLGSIVSPKFSVWMLASYLLAKGIGADPATAHLVLAGCGVALLLITPVQRRVTAAIAASRKASSHRIPLRDLVPQRGARG